MAKKGTDQPLHKLICSFVFPICNKLGFFHDTALIIVVGLSHKKAAKKVRCISVRVDLSLVVRKPVFGVSDLAPYKLSCTVTYDG